MTVINSPDNFLSTQILLRIENIIKIVKSTMSKLDVSEENQKLALKICLGMQQGGKA